MEIQKNNITGFLKTNRPLLSEDLYFYSGAVRFQKTSDVNFLYLNKLTVRDIFGKKEWLYRKIRTTNEFFGVDLPRESQIIKNYLVLAKNYMGLRFKWPYYI